MRKVEGLKTKLKTTLTKIFDELKFVLIFTGIFVVFSDFIFKSHQNFIIEPILSKANNSIMADLILLTVLIIILISIIKKIMKGYYVKLSQVLFCLIVLSIYGYYRVTKSTLFLSFQTIEQVKYFDVLFLFFAIPIVLKVFRYLQKKDTTKTDSNRLLIDSSILSSDEDVLGRKSKANRIYKEIIQLKSNESIAFGIVGAWGSGKTSFLNLIKENFKKNSNKNTILIDFNPWLNISLDSIVQDYFNTLESELKEHSVDISKTFRKYGNSVLNLHKNKLTDSLLKGSNLMFDSNLTDEYKQLNELLKNLNKRVLVFIDDFDRLKANEIFEILKLIRNTGGFDTFTYVVAYDKEYLIESLDKYQIPNPKNFSEKIFLKELQLLPVTNIQINSYLSEELIKRFKEKEDEINDLFINDISKYYPRGTFKNTTWALKNLRDVKRFINSFVIDYDEIKNEVLFRDYFILKLLKFKFYNAYILLFTNRDDFIEQEKYNTSSNKNLKYILKLDKEGARSSVYDVFKNSKFREYITNNLNYNDNELNTIASMMNSLFTKLSSLKDNLSVSYEVNYYKYFKDELSLENLSIVEFKEVMALSFDEVKTNMRKWYNDGKQENIRYYLNDTKVYELKDRDEYEKYIKAMFFLANFESKDIRGRRNVFGFELHILWNNLNSDNYRIAETFYNNDSNELSEFFKSILDSAKSPYEYESLFCYNLYNRIDLHSSIVDKETIKNYLIKYFKTHAESVAETDDNFWNLFHLCCVANWKQVSGNSYNKNEAYLDEAKEVFKEAMTRNLDYFLVIFVHTQSFYGHEKKDNKLGISELSLKLFGTHRSFLEFLKSKNLKDKLTKPSEFLSEFIQFAEEFIKKEEMTEFEFTYPEVNKKLNRIIESQNY